MVYIGTAMAGIANVSNAIPVAKIPTTMLSFIFTIHQVNWQKYFAYYQLSLPERARICHHQIFG